MKRLTSLVGVMFVLSSGLMMHAQSPQAVREDGDPTIRVNVSVVTVDAAVMSKKTGRAIEPLTPQDFVVYEDGVPQRIAYFSQDELPLSVVLLFDLTDSVRPVLKSLGEGALAALNHLKPQDEVAVMVYASKAELLQDFTTDRELAAKAVRTASEMKSDEAAFFNEGLYQAAQHSAGARNPHTRRVIIWLTDNVPNIPSEEIKLRYGRSLKKAPLHTERQALDELLRSGDMVCALVRKSEISEEHDMLVRAHWAEWMMQKNQYPPGDVYRYAQQTGGEVAESNARRMPEKLAAMIDSIRARYTIGYKPTVGAAGFREVQVKVVPEVERRAGKVVVVAKKGYWR